jgi:hypothetical protein
MEWIPFNTKIDGFLSFNCYWMVMYFFASHFLISPCLWPNSRLWCCVFLILYITSICIQNLQMAKWHKTHQLTNLQGRTSIYKEWILGLLLLVKKEERPILNYNKLLILYIHVVYIVVTRNWMLATTCLRQLNKK